MKRTPAWLIAPAMFLALILGGCMMGPALMTFMEKQTEQRAPWLLWVVIGAVILGVLGAIGAAVLKLLESGQRW